MLNVMMGILAFFVMITMTLSAEQGVEIELPQSAQNALPQAPPELLLVQLDAEGQVMLNDQLLTKEQLQAQVTSYLSSSSEGFVVLQADPKTPYEQVVKTLQTMKKIGGDRVSLAVD